MNQVGEFREHFLRLEELNERVGMQTLYQIHSGRDGIGDVGSSVWDVAGMMAGIDTRF